MVGFGYFSIGVGLLLMHILCSFGMLLLRIKVNVIVILWNSCRKAGVGSKVFGPAWLVLMVEIMGLINESLAALYIYYFILYK